jgi:hypothetical protein
MPGEPDPAQAQRTWVILTEAGEGGWSINGTGLRRRAIHRAAPQAARR